MKHFKYLQGAFSKLYLLKKEKHQEDFNFFSPYIVKKKEVKNKYLYASVTAGLLLFVFLGNFLWNYIKINEMTNEIAEMKNIISSSEMKKKIAEADELNKKNDVLNKYYSEVKAISSAISKKEVISSDLMKKISSELPQSVSIKTMSIDEQNIQIQGTAGNRVNIGEFQYNLKQLEELKDVQVVNISKNISSNTNNNQENSNVEIANGEVTFTLKCTLKDVESDEN